MTLTLILFPCVIVSYFYRLSDYRPAVLGLMDREPPPGPQRSV